MSRLARTVVCLLAGASCALAAAAQGPSVVLVVDQLDAAPDTEVNVSELPAAGSRDLRFYGTDGTTIDEQEDGALLVTDGGESFVIPDRAFNLRSFRSNVVLRWEWRPGSTLFVVWQQDRFGGLGPRGGGGTRRARRTLEKTPVSVSGPAEPRRQSLPRLLRVARVVVEGGRGLPHGLLQSM